MGRFDVGWATLAGLFLFMGAALGFEVVLVRFFSIILWHHLAFMVVSIAMLGLGGAGTFLALKPELSEKKADYIPGFGSLGFVLFACLGFFVLNRLPLDSTRLSWSLIELIYLLFYYIVFGAAFFFVGLVVASLLQRFPKDTSLVYGINLIGSAVGCVIGLYVLSLYPGGVVLIPLFFMALVSAVLFSWQNPKWRWKVGLVSALVFLTLIFLPVSWYDLSVSPYKGLALALTYPGAHVRSMSFDPTTRLDVIESRGIHYAPGLSLNFKGEIPKQQGITVDGGNLQGLTSGDCTPGNWEFTDYLPSALGYYLKKNATILVAGVGGGLDLLSARCHNANSIVGIDNNRLLVEELEKIEYGLDGPSIKLVSENERRFLLRDEDLYDLIIIPPSQSIISSTSGLFGSNEDYRYTVEAFQEYHRHLKPDGLIIVTRWFHFPPREHLRLASLAVSSLEDVGASDPSGHIVVFRSPVTYSLIMKKNKFDNNEIEAINRFLDSRGYASLYPQFGSVEGIVDEFTTELLKAIIEEGPESKYASNYVFDVGPVYDDRPYLSNYVKWTQLREFVKSVEGRPHAFLEGGFLIMVVFIEAIMISLFLFFLPLVKIKSFPKGTGYMSAYFFFIGVAFMLIEVSLIQKFILVLGWPIYSFAFIVTVLLVFAGFGSLILPKLSTRIRKQMLFCLPFLIFFLSVVSYTNWILEYGLINSLLTSIVILAPIGFLMGLPFPIGLEIAAAGDQKSIPWMWASNAFASVIASVAAALISLELGFTVVLLIAGICYLAAFMIVSQRM
ncbi:MAG: class I SAM-dependent methyltransferase [Candidatus Altiarchaeota archaeon]